MNILNFKEISDIKDNSLTIYIEPVAPLHMSVSTGGRYNNTIVKPTNNMIFGLLENILGLHLSLEMRKSIKKSLKSKNKSQTSSQKSFMPILNDYVNVGNVELISDSIEYFDDLSKYLYNRTDKSHYQGVENFDISFAYNERKDYGGKKYLDKFPEFYKGIIKKQYVIINGFYKVSLSLSDEMKDVIIKSIGDVSSGYLGSSESLVNVKLNLN